MKKQQVLRFNEGDKVIWSLVENSKNAIHGVITHVDRDPKSKNKPYTIRITKVNPTNINKVGDTIWSHDKFLSADV